jgi:signal transduction histidine kinase
MQNFWNKIKLIWTDKILRKRVLFVLFALIIFRLLAAIPIPGIDTIKLHADRMEITSHINSQLSHEIRSPLSAFNVNLGFIKNRMSRYLNISECSSIALEDLRTCENIVTEMEYQVEYIEGVLNHLSEYSKLSAINLDTIDFGHTTNATLKLMKVASLLKELDPGQLLINIEDIKDITINGSTVWISQILWNLLMNAYEAIDENGKIYVVGKHTESYVYLRICNTGFIDENTIEKIFDPYVTTKLHGSHRGLGLSIVKSLVLKQNGFVWAYNFFCDYSQKNIVVVNIRFPRSENTNNVIHSIDKTDNITTEEIEKFY